MKSKTGRAPYGLVSLAGACAAFVLFAVTAPGAAAQDFPSRTLTIVVPTGAGGGMDLLGRFAAAQLSQRLQQSVVVENKVGAGTLLGTETVRNASPDGYTLLVGGSSNMSLNPGLFKNIRYDAINDFIPVGYLVEYPMVLVARKDFPASNFKELRDLVSASPGKFNYASAGAGTGQHVWTELLFKDIGLNVTHIPFKGSAGAYIEILAGRVDFMMDNISAAQPHIRAGSIKPIAVSSTFRAAQLPDVPTIDENGVKFEAISWMGIFAPKETPRDVIAKLTKELETIRQSPELKTFVERNGGRRSEIAGDQQRASYLANDLQKWKTLIERHDLVMQ